MFKKGTLPIAVITLGVLVISVLVTAKPQPTPSPPEQTPALVKVGVIQSQAETSQISVTTQGTVTPKREIDLVAQVSGQIIAVESEFVEGGFFSESQVFVQIDDRDYQVALLTAKARLAEAQRLVAEEMGLSTQARREWRDLGNQSANELFIRKPQLASAEANLAAAQGEVAMAELNLERTRIVAPFTGRIKQKYVDLGQFVSRGNPIASIYDSTAAEVRLALTERQAALIRLPLLAATTQSPPPRVELRGLVAGTEYHWQGLLTRSDGFVDTQSRMYYAIVEVAETLGRASTPPGAAPLLPGLFVEATIEGKTLKGVRLLPRSALYQRDKIITLDENNTVSKHTVNVLRSSDELVWIQTSLSGLINVTTEKQTLTPVGSIVDPQLEEILSLTSPISPNKD